MSRALSIAAVLGLFACGRDHVLQEGRYGLAVAGVIRDDCQLAADPEVTRSADLVLAGDTLSLDYSLFAMHLVGAYLKGVERFAVDGSAANVVTPVRSQQCLLDLVTTHLEAATRDPTHFDGNLAVKLEAQKEACQCELWVSYAAAFAAAQP